MLCLHYKHCGGGAVGKSVLLACGRWNPSRNRSNRSNSLKQVVTAALVNARQEVHASRFLLNDLYKRMTSGQVDSTRYRTFTAQWR